MTAELAVKVPIPGDAARFFWTALVAFPINFAILLLMGAHVWGSALMGAVVIAWIAGIVALCIPVRKKAAFIVPGVIGGLVISFGLLWFLAIWWEP